jgi:hypothetical protein
VECGTEIGHDHTYICTITVLVTVRNFEITSDRSNVERICTYVSSSQKEITTTTTTTRIIIIIIIIIIITTTTIKPSKQQRNGIYTYIRRSVNMEI